MGVDMLNTTVVDDDAPTAPPTSQDPGGDFLDYVPFEPLYQKLVAHACSTVELAAGHHGRYAAAAVLRSLPRYNTLEGADLEAFEQRAANADLSLLDETVDGFDWQEIAADFFGLFNFARHGETRARDAEDPRTEIKRLLQNFRRLVADQGTRAAVGSDFEWITDTLAAAEARWVIDNGLPVAPENLAALAGVKQKTLSNLIAAGQLAVDPDGRISPVQALQYLDRRKNFVRSTWQTPVDVPPPDNETQATALEEQIFVPVDSDGGPFLPSLARRSRDGQARYIIGEKASPVYVEDYWDALAQLARMATPRWRRPGTGGGGWGLVSAQDGWRRFAKADIQRMVEAVGANLGIHHIEAHGRANRTPHSDNRSGV
jgi:hypothetical protein